jgi:superfamily I DNA/RNA helicase
MPHPEPERRESVSPGTSLPAGLTPEQAQAVTHGTGPLLLIAGPGAGKTRTLIHRIAHLLESEQARPDQILAVTFSVRAAGELRLRLADLLGQERGRAVTAATFHSVCARLLREHAQLFGRTERYTIYDQGDMRRTSRPKSSSSPQRTQRSVGHARVASPIRTTILFDRRSRRCYS